MTFFLECVSEWERITRKMNGASRGEPSQLSKNQKVKKKGNLIKKELSTVEKDRREMFPRDQYRIVEILQCWSLLLSKILISHTLEMLGRRRDFCQCHLKSYYSRSVISNFFSLIKCVWNGNFLRLVWVQKVFTELNQVMGFLFIPYDRIVLFTWRRKRRSGRWKSIRRWRRRKGWRRRLRWKRKLYLQFSVKKILIEIEWSELSSRDAMEESYMNMNFSKHNLYSSHTEQGINYIGFSLVQEEKKIEQECNMLCCTMSWAIKWIKRLINFV